MSLYTCREVGAVIGLLNVFFYFYPYDLFSEILELLLNDSHFPLQISIQLK